jgi:excisionase family DNA binding protein
MLSVKQAAARANVCESVVRQWVRARVLPHYRLGGVNNRGKIAITVEDLDAFLATLKVEKVQPEPARELVSRAVPKLKLRHLRLPSA